MSDRRRIHIITVIMKTSGTMPTVPHIVADPPSPSGWVPGRGGGATEPSLPVPGRIVISRVAWVVRVVPPEVTVVTVAVIGRTGRGNYGHGLDVVWKEFPNCQIVAVADDNAGGRANAEKRRP